MIWKILTFAVAAFTLWAALRNVLGGRAPAAERRPRASAAAELIPCRDCGAWSTAGDPCPCRTPPTP